jgi:YlmC/YmxH family sporulation protein
MRIEDLRYKEVINVHTGQKLGYVSDVEFSLTEGRVTALVVPGPVRCMGLLGREEDYVLPFDCIQRIGEDLIIVEFPENRRQCGKGRRKGGC